MKSLLNALIVAALVCACVMPAAGCSSAYQAGHFNSGAARESSQGARVIESLAIAPGSSLADLGAGGGHFTMLLARATGPGGRVYAIDINPEFLDFIRERASGEGISNVECVRGTFTDSGLPAGSADLVFARCVFHDIQDRAAYFTRLRTVLKPGGRVAIIDYLPGGILERIYGHFISEKEILDTMGAAGYHAVKRFTFIEGQSFNIFEPVTE
jgi:arsenite methyltransferase